MSTALVQTGERVYFSSQSKGTWQEGQGREHLKQQVTTHAHTIRVQNMCQSAHFELYGPGFPVQGIVLPTIKMGLSTSVNTAQAWPEAVLNPVKQTTGTIL